MEIIDMDDMDGEEVAVLLPDALEQALRMRPARVMVGGGYFPLTAVLEKDCGCCGGKFVYRQEGGAYGCDSCQKWRGDYCGKCGEIAPFRETRHFLLCGVCGQALTMLGSVPKSYRDPRPEAHDDEEPLGDFFGLAARLLGGSVHPPR